MGKQKEGKTITRRDLLKLAGTAAAFSSSFGFLYAGKSGQLTSQDDKLKGNTQLFLKWKQAELKWYAKGQLLHTADVPAVVLKILQTDVNGSVEIKFFRGGTLLRSLGQIESKF
jgi:hypothetical protein